VAAGIGATVRPLTIANYRAITRRYVKGRDIGAVPPRSLTAGHLNALYAEMEAEGLSVATRRLTHAAQRAERRGALGQACP
jgi:hypothetical protein